MGPRIGEGAPTRFKLGKAEFVARDGDAVFVDFKPRGLIDNRSYFQGRATIEEPGSQGDAVAEVIKQRAAAMLFFVKPAVRLLSCHRLSRCLFLPLNMPERAAIAIVVVYLDDLADCAL